MENINYIYGETPQGELITFDGFSPMQSMKKKELLLDLLFKSGSYVTVYAMKAGITCRKS